MLVLKVSFIITCVSQKVHRTRKLCIVQELFSSGYLLLAFLSHRCYSRRVEDPGTRKDTRRRDNFSLGNLHAEITIRVVPK